MRQDCRHIHSSQRRGGQQRQACAKEIDYLASVELHRLFLLSLLPRPPKGDTFRVFSLLQSATGGTCSVCEGRGFCVGMMGLVAGAASALEGSCSCRSHHLNFARPSDSVLLKGSLRSYLRSICSGLYIVRIYILILFMIWCAMKPVLYFFRAFRMLVADPVTHSRRLLLQRREPFLSFKSVLFRKVHTPLEILLPRSIVDSACFGPR